jgi:hypothetical protein
MERVLCFKLRIYAYSFQSTLQNLVLHFCSYKQECSQQQNLASACLLITFLFQQMGVALGARARIQLNLAVSQVVDIKQVATFPDIVFPIMWFEEVSIH